MAEINSVTVEVLPGAPVFLMGGGPAAAIRHDTSQFDHSGKRLVATNDSAESTLRDNGTKRDLDLLAFRVLDNSEGPTAERGILEAIDHRMVVSVFGLEQYQQPSLGNRLKHSLFDWTSRRTIDENGVHRYEIYPLEQVIPEADLVYEPWEMVLPRGGSITIMSPDTTVYNYDVRSISPRRKDAVKLAAMKQRIHAEPEFLERIIGPLKPVQDLALAIDDLGHGRLHRNDQRHKSMFVPDATFMGRGAFRARTKLYDIGQQSDLVTKVVGHSETVQNLIKVTTGRK